jgi:hypothetical protein
MDFTAAAPYNATITDHLAVHPQRAFGAFFHA